MDRPLATTETHVNARLEAFCDGVFAIAITLLVIDIKLPAPERLASTPEVWRALLHLAPSVLAFLLTFFVILMTWVSHHGFLAHLNRASTAFIWANGFLLLTVVFIPFPTSLLGELVFTDHAAPGVVLYDAVLAVQGIAWVALGRTALNHRLFKDAPAEALIRVSHKNAYFGVVLYSLLAVAAFWIPLAAAAMTAASWILWVSLGIAVNRARLVAAAEPG